MRAISPKLSDGGRQQLKSGLLGRARQVADTTGGILNVGWKISPAEKDVLAKLEKAFSA